MAEVQLLNYSSSNRVGNYVTLGVAFEKGYLFPNDDLVALGATSGREKVQWYSQGMPWNDGSVRFARCTFKTDLNGNSDKKVNIIKSSIHDTIPGFNPPLNIINSHFNTKFIFRFKPKKPVKLPTPIVSATTTFNGQQKTLKVVFEESFSYSTMRIRFTNLPQVMIGYQNPTFTGRRFWTLEKVDPRLATTNEYWISSSEMASEWPDGAPSVFSNPFTTPYMGGFTSDPNAWQFEVKNPQEVHVDLGGSISNPNVNLISTEILEGDPNSPTSTDVYYRTRYFLRFADLPDLKLKPIYVELVVDFYKDSPVAYFWATMGNQYTEVGRGTQGGTYNEISIFFDGDIELEVTNTSSAVPAPLAYLREELYESYGTERLTNRNIFKIWSSDPPNVLPDISRIPNKDVLGNCHAIAKKGVLVHATNVPPEHRAETEHEIAGICTEFGDKFPFFPKSPGLPSWIQSRDQGINQLNDYATHEEGRRTPRYQYFMKDIFSSNPSPGDPASQGGGSGKLGRAFGAFQGYFMFNLGWPVLNKVLLWRLRNDYNRPMFFMNPQGEDLDPWDLHKYHKNALDQGIFFIGSNSTFALNTNSRDYLGLSLENQYGFNNYPEGALISGGGFKSRREQLWAANQDARTRSFIGIWPKSHWMQQWSFYTAIITMDYHAIRFIDYIGRYFKAQNNPESTTDTVYGTLQPPRAVGRPFHMSALYYTLLYDPEQKAIAEKMLGGFTNPSTNTLRGAWNSGAVKTIVSDNVNFPGNKLNYVPLHLAGEGFEGRTVWTESWTSIWMEAIFARGLYAWYNILKEEYNGEGNFNQQATNIKLQAAYIAGSVIKHGFFLDARNNGNYEVLEGSLAKITPFSEEPNTDPTLIDKDTSPVYWHAARGDLVTCEEDLSVTGELEIIHAIDNTNYSGVSTHPDNKPYDLFNLEQNPWRMGYYLIIKNKNKQFPSPCNIIHIDTQEKIFRLSRAYDGYMIAYAYHLGFTPQKGAPTYAQQRPGDPFLAGNPGPVLPSGTPPTGEYFHWTADWEYSHMWLGSNPTPNTLNRNNFRKPLYKDKPRFFSTSQNLNAWAWNALPIALDFASQNFYGEFNSEIEEKARSIVSDELDKLAPVGNFSFDEDFYPQVDLFPGTVLQGNKFIPVAPLNLGISVSAVGLGGTIVSNARVLPSTVLLANNIPPIVPITSSGGGGNTRYSPSPIRMRFNVRSPEIKLEAFTILTPDTILIETIVNDVRVTAKIKRQIVYWSRMLEMKLNLIADEPIVEFGSGGYAGDEPSSSAGYLSKDDIIELLGPIGGEGAYDDPNYQGPTEGHYDDNGTNTITGVNINDWFDSSNFYVIYDKYYEPQEVAPLE